MIKQIIYLALLLITISSCEKDESKNPLATIVPGNFVRLDITSRAFDAANKSNTFFGGNLTAPNGNVVKYEIFVRAKNNLDITIGNFVLLKTITSFPSELKITTNELATALNIAESSIQQAYRFDFYCYSYDSDGNVSTFNSLSSVLRSEEALKQGFRYNTGVELQSAIATYDNYQLP